MGSAVRANASDPAPAADTFWIVGRQIICACVGGMGLSHVTMIGALCCQGHPRPASLAMNSFTQKYFKLLRLLRHGPRSSLTSFARLACAPKIAEVTCIVDIA